MNMHLAINQKELLIAKKAAKTAGDFLIKNKFTLNQTLSSNNKDIIGHFNIWKEDHLVYLVKSNTPRLKFVIPNLVYDNISTYCKK